MPDAADRATLERVTWDWLSGHPALLFGFIMLVLGVPPTITANWQLIQSTVRRVRPKRPAPPAVVAVPKVNAPKGEAAEAPAPTLGLPSSPRVMLRPDYRYSGGAASTSAVMDVASYMPYAITPPDSDHLQSLSAVFRSGIAAGTAATR